MHWNRFWPHVLAFPSLTYFRLAFATLVSFLDRSYLLFLLLFFTLAAEAILRNVTLTFLLLAWRNYGRGSDKALGVKGSMRTPDTTAHSRKLLR